MQFERGHGMREVCLSVVIRPGPPLMDAAAFVDKWRKSRRTERSASQEHFLDLCELLHHPKPGAFDPKGLTFTTERWVKKEGGKHGFADAWKKGYFGWEYKKRGADLSEAYNQYRPM